MSRILLLLAASTLFAQETEAVYSSAKGVIALPNKCAEVDLDSLGLTCSEQEPCPTYLEISSAELNNSTIVLAGNLHTPTTTIQSILLFSEDEGATWREAHARLPGATLEAMQFFDFTHGWLSGHSTLGLPRDPFILLTTDGGRAWRKSPLFAESRVGVVEKFNFESARRGWVLVDNKGSGDAGRFELYETTNGGVIWNLKEINDRIPAEARADRQASSVLRVRGDAKQNVLHLERQDAGKWTGLSRFRLRLEDCTPPPPAD
ncbi:MAG: hypothetical protein NW208_03670 [Bryobacter sp.]|nr:hypothetical protein [Bryobacter sp.]